MFRFTDCEVFSFKELLLKQMSYLIILSLYNYFTKLQIQHILQKNTILLAIRFHKKGS